MLRFFNRPFDFKSYFNSFVGGDKYKAGVRGNHYDILVSDVVGDGVKSMGIGGSSCGDDGGVGDEKIGVIVCGDEDVVSTCAGDQGRDLVNSGHVDQKVGVVVVDEAYAANQESLIDEILFDDEEQKEEEETVVAVANDGTGDFSKAFSAVFDVVRKKVRDLLAGNISTSDFASFCRAVVACIRMLETILPYVGVFFTMIISLFYTKQKVKQNAKTNHVSFTPHLVKVAFLLHGVKDLEHVSFYIENKRLHITGFALKSCLQESPGLVSVDTYADLPPANYSSASTKTCFNNETGIFLVTITGFK